MRFFTNYVLLIFLIKICFIILSAIHIYLKVKGKTNSNIDNNIIYWRDRLEFIFVILMSFLLIYVFNPRKDKSYLINNETKILFYLFGFVLLITAKWSNFIETAKWFQHTQYILGK